MSTAELLAARDAVLRAHEAAPHKLLVVVGPTATGKTELALTLAEVLGAELINADSVQIVRGFDIGSGKPTAEEQARAPHHLFDIVEPHEDLDAAEYARRAERTLDEVRARGATPIVVGGTFFWVRTLLYGLIETPPADTALRQAHDQLVRERGAQALHEELAQLDPEAAARLHPNDVVRVSRAIEIYRLTGQQQSELFRQHGFRETKHEPLLIGRATAPAELDRRIEARAAHWLAHGWIEEVEAMVERGHRSAKAMGSVGYKQVLDCLDGALARDELLPSVVRATRVFARRQRTWLKKADVRWL